MVKFCRVLLIASIAWATTFQDRVLAGRHTLRHRAIHKRIRRNASSLYEDSSRPRSNATQSAVGLMTNSSHQVKLESRVATLAKEDDDIKTLLADVLYDSETNRTQSTLDTVTNSSNRIELVSHLATPAKDDNPSDSNISILNQDESVELQLDSVLEDPQSNRMQSTFDTVANGSNQIDLKSRVVTPEEGVDLGESDISIFKQDDKFEIRQGGVLNDPIVDEPVATTKAPQEQYKYYVRPKYINGQVLDQFLFLHNDVRTHVLPTADQMLKMSWDYTLEGNAWKYTQKCQFDPSPKWERKVKGFQTVGENRWVAWGFPMEELIPEQVIGNWLNEATNFDASLRSCIGGVCENYVQLIWATTYKVGCAYSLCDRMSVYGFEVKAAVFVACHYGPGRREYPLIPYYHGLSCSFCDKDDICKSKLCTNPSRDKTTGTYPYPTHQQPTSYNGLSTSPAGEETMISLIVIGSLAGFTLLVTIIILLGARAAHRIAESDLTDYLRNIPRRLSHWYERRRRKSNEIRVSKAPSRASIEYHANLWNEETTALS